MNLLQPLPDASSDERFEDLFQRPGCRVERIVSLGHSSPPGFWFDQDWDEWVLILAGSAVMRLETRNEPIALAPGDCLMISAGARHRVESTAAGVPTVWLALHFDKDNLRQITQ